MKVCNGCDQLLFRNEVKPGPFDHGSLLWTWTVQHWVPMPDRPGVTMYCGEVEER